MIKENYDKIQFSIILPVRNGGEYIKLCVKSIFEQTYTNFNLIVLDNYSTDNTVEWLRSLNNDRIIIYTSAISLTIEESWARATTIPTNEFITLIGHDDILYPNFLETIAGLIRSEPGAGLYHTHFDFINAKGYTIRHSRPMPAKLSPAEFIASVLSLQLDVMGTGYVMRSEDYRRISGIPPYPSLLFADYEMWIKLIGNSFEAISPLNCFAFRKHFSTTTTSKDDIYLKAFDQFCSFLFELRKKSTGISQAINDHIGGYLQHTMISISHRLLRTPAKLRPTLTVESVEARFKTYAKRFGVQEEYQPGKIKSFVIAKWIDSNSILRGLFLQFKKIYSKPVAG